MVALADYRASLHSCGHPLEETTAPDAEGRYVVDLPARCHACHALASKQAEYREVEHPQALLFRAERRR